MVSEKVPGQTDQKRKRKKKRQRKRKRQRRNKILQSSVHRKEKEEGKAAVTW